MNKLLGNIALFLVFLSSSVYAVNYERDAKYIYKVTPYSEIVSTNDGVRYTTEITQVALESVLDSMKELGIFPEKIENVIDIEKRREALEKVGELVDYLNELVEEGRALAGAHFDLPTDIVPDAFVIFTGRKVSAAALSGSMTLGIVVMPVYEEVYNPETGEKVSEGLSVRASIVGWPAGDIGVAVGGGPRWRFGAMLVWDMNDAFTHPEQFWGGGPGVSIDQMAGVGVNLKAGVVANWEMEGWLDFAYLSGAFEVGPAVDFGLPRINGTLFISGEALMGAFTKAQQDSTTRALRSIEKKIEDRLGDGSDDDKPGHKKNRDQAKVNAEENLDALEYRK